MIKKRTNAVTGNLRNNFHSYRDKNNSDAKKVTVTVANNLEYASYVEKGHWQSDRYVPAIGKKIRKRWVQGKFMMRISVRLYKDNLMHGRISKFIDRKQGVY